MSKTLAPVLTPAEKRKIVAENIGEDRPIRMDSFFFDDKKERPIRGDSLLNKIVRKPSIVADKNVCGTSCCIAGDALLRFPEETAKIVKQYRKEGYQLMLDRIAGELLDVDESAFYVGSWPEHLLPAKVRRAFPGYQRYGTFDKLPLAQQRRTVAKILKYFANK